MKRLLRTRPTPAMVVACIALAVALGGTSYAAVALPRNSVGTKQLKNRAVTGQKVQEHTLGASKLKSGVLPRISNYYTQAQSNARYLRGTITKVAAKTIPAGGSADVSVACPEGHEAIGGGVDSNETGFVYITSSSPLYDGNVRLHTVTEGEHIAAEGWFASAFNNSSTAVFPLKVAVICAPIGVTP